MNYISKYLSVCHAYKVLFNKFPVFLPPPKKKRTEFQKQHPNHPPNNLPKPVPKFPQKQTHKLSPEQPCGRESSFSTTGTNIYIRFRCPLKRFVKSFKRLLKACQRFLKGYLNKETGQRKGGLATGASRRLSLAKKSKNCTQT